MKIKQHYPGYCSGFEIHTGEFNNYDELIAIPFVGKWETEPGDSEFNHYAIASNYTKDCSLLIAMFVKSHWVIGYINSPVVDWLPEADYRKYEHESR